MTKYYTLVSCFLYCFEWTKLLYYYFFLLGNLNFFVLQDPEDLAVTGTPHHKAIQQDILSDLHLQARYEINSVMY